MNRPYPARQRAAFVVRVIVLTVVLLVVARPTGAGGDQTNRVFVPLAAGKAAFSATPLGVFNQATAITHAGDDRLFVAERDGRIKIIHPDGRTSVFLDIRHRVIATRGEYGFYDIAFHPDYADPDVADPNSEAILIAEPQTDDIHKGGSMEFDPRDNRLYIGIGDDFKNLIAQDATSLKGKLVRLAVDDVPRGLAGGRRATVAPEIWASGLRNPWRIDVDAIGDQVLIGDVGDAHWEEVNRAPLSAPGTNFGWPCLEGPLVKPEFANAAVCQNPARFQRAVHEYSHRDEDNNRCVVIGGKVNRPSYNPTDGRYLFADMCSREVFALGYDPDGSWQRALLGVVGDELIITIGEDRHGLQYVGTAAEAGPIYRLYVP